MENFPKISIVTPSFNQGEFLEDTIVSVLEQNYPNLEYIIIDGGSTDNSIEIIKKYEKHLKFWVSEKDNGQSHAINKGFSHATGDWFTWLNSDDYLTPGALDHVAETAARHPEAGAIVGAGEMLNVVTKETVLIEPFPITLQSLYGGVDRYFMQPSCFFTRATWQECGPLDEKLHLAMDLDLWLRIAKKTSFAVTANTLSVSLIHQGAKTTALAAQSLVDASLVIMRHGGEKEGRDRLVRFVQELQEEKARNHELAAQLQAVKTLYANERELLSSQLKEAMAAHEIEKSTLLNALSLSQNDFNDVVCSLSWKISSPLRFVGKRILAMFHKRKPA